jgi:hypothetical protein
MSRTMGCRPPPQLRSAMIIIVASAPSPMLPDLARILAAL